MPGRRSRTSSPRTPPSRVTLIPVGRGGEWVGCDDLPVCIQGQEVLSRQLEYLAYREPSGADSRIQYGGHGETAGVAKARSTPAWSNRPDRQVGLAPRCSMFYLTRVMHDAQPGAGPWCLGLKTLSG